MDVLPFKLGPVRWLFWSTDGIKGTEMRRSRAVKMKGEAGIYVYFLRGRRVRENSRGIGRQRRKTSKLMEQQIGEAAKETQSPARFRAYRRQGGRKGREVSILRTTQE